MKSLKLFVSTIAIASAITACDSKKEEKTTENIQGTPIEASVVSENQRELMKTIVGDPTGLIRGLNIGDNISKIKTTETFDIFEDSTDHVGYTYETKDFESIDVLYYLDANKALQSTKIDVYLNNQASVTALMDLLDSYLSSRFKVDKKEPKKRTWKNTDNTAATLEDVTQGKDFGIRLRIGANSSKAFL